MKAFIAAIALAISLALVSAPAQAHPGHNYGSWSAAKVARHINCRNFHRTPPGVWVHSSGVCWLKGHRVNVITFTTRNRELKWGAWALTVFGPKFYVAFGAGAVVVAKNGNRPAAVAGARALGTAKVLHG